MRLCEIVTAVFLCGFCFFAVLHLPLAIILYIFVKLISNYSNPAK